MMFFSNDIFISLRWHELKLFSTICIIKTIDEEIKEINFFYFPDKFVNFAHKLGRVHVIYQVYI